MNETELLFTQVLNCDRASLCLNRDLVLDREKSARISSCLKRRVFGEPIQYILARTEFMGLEFRVTPDVLIPRPETEILVEAAMKFSSSVIRHPSFVNILDLGTGSGCIAVSLAKYLSDVKITATDTSQKALEIAKFNACKHNVADKIDFVLSDLFTNYQLPALPAGRPITNYDVIISNPPYIPTALISTLQPEVQYEPRIALDGGPDGLEFYRRLSREAGIYLKKEGFLILETGFNQMQAVKNILQNEAKFEIIEIVRDYNNIERVVVARKAK